MPPKRPASPSQPSTEEEVELAKKRARPESFRSDTSDPRTAYRSHTGHDSIDQTEGSRTEWDPVDNDSIRNAHSGWRTTYEGPHRSESSDPRMNEGISPSKIPDGTLETRVNEPDRLGKISLNVMGPGDFSATPRPVTEVEKIMLLRIRIATTKLDKGKIENETAEARRLALNRKYKSDIVSGLEKVAQHLHRDVRSAAFSKAIEWAEEKGIRSELQFCS
jgi:hypothetical protein